jgi:hypothetical protein
MKPCRYCGASIYWNDKIKDWIESDTDEIHHCQKSPGKKGVLSNNDNVTIGKMLDAKAAVEVSKPSKERDQITKLSQDLYSLDNEFQDYKRKTDKRISELEDRITKSGGDVVMDENK